MFPKDKFWTTANTISVLRLLLLIPLFLLLREGDRGNGNMWALVVMGIALLSDLADGIVARTFKQETVWGRILDPIADKLWIGCLALFLAMPWREHPLPWQFLAAVLIRDAAIVAFAVYAYRRTKVVMKSNWAGKIAMTFAAFTLIAYTVYWIPERLSLFRPETLMWLTILLLVLSSSVYMYRFRMLLQSHPTTKPFPAAQTPSPLKTTV